MSELKPGDVLFWQRAGNDQWEPTPYTIEKIGRKWAMASYRYFSIARKWDVASYRRINIETLELEGADRLWWSEDEWRVWYETNRAERLNDDAWDAFCRKVQAAWRRPVGVDADTIRQAALLLGLEMPG